MPPALVPGRLITLDDGTDCVVVRGNQIPRSFWAAKKKKSHGHEADYPDRYGKSTPVVSVWRGDKWTYFDAPPGHPWYDGALIEGRDEAEGMPIEHVAVIVPLSAMKPEQNEFGEVSP